MEVAQVADCHVCCLKRKSEKCCALFTSKNANILSNTLNPIAYGKKQRSRALSAVRFSMKFNPNAFVGLTLVVFCAPVLVHLSVN